MQGSGSFVVESVLTSAIKPTDTLFIITNEAYGKRMVGMADVLGLSYIELAWDFDEALEALPKEADVVRLYESFEGQLFNTLQQFTTLISGVVEAVHALRANGVKIGSTTGYTREMIDIVKVDAAEKGMHQTAL